LVGGDTVKTSNPFFDLFVFGESESFPMLRENAKSGDLVGVTGTFGDARAGLEQLLNNEEKDKYLIERFLNPQARLDEGLGALKLGVKCATDVSDGLAFNLYTIAESSKVMIKVNSNLIPVSDNLVSFCGTMERALTYALYGGEDYELIVTFPEKLQQKMENIGFKVIGYVCEGEGVYLDGKLLKKSGYDHFKEESDELFRLTDSRDS
jgi:thiamine-monophosphate kinase